MVCTEVKTIKINRECVKNPIFISWLNTYGGREHWLFSGVQTIGLTTSEKGEFEPFVNDLQNSRGQIKTTEIGAVPQLIVNAYVDIEDVQGLKTILYSSCVEILMNPNEWSSTVAPIWQIIRPKTGSFKIYNTNETHTTIEISFDLPYIYTQRQ
jgi:hypothetical protein